ncbi:hypothetical protein SAMN03084138_01954 [Enterovibrio norvegicus DSM 15893]|uniref:PD-(D/E)XK nuclease superfamily protein n=2 Tax=Enterovibrio norvegicus TaxID=188144 RepID=A0A1I5PG60_9GAMM|nr:hypothetical protein SAMN03084138_01954 [Enterovibrio norvegicus DSM 15893]
MLELSHIGEDLICRIINHSEACKAHICRSLGISNAVIAVPELSLDTCSGFRFDGTHRVDVCLLDRGSLTCFPIEAKLGTSRLSRTEFGNRFLQPCKTSHKDTRISGSMISVLERNLPVQCIDNELAVTYEGQRYDLSVKWGLVVREKVSENWKKNGYPNTSKSCEVLIFEELIDILGSAELFNEHVSSLLALDYHKEWIGLR